MRILICSLQYSAQSIGVGKYTAEMAEWLAERGHEVRVVTTPPYYPHWKVQDGYSAARYSRSDEAVACSRTERGSTVEIFRCPVWVPKVPSGSRRLLHLASFSLSSFPVMLAAALWKPDVVMLIEPTLFSAPHVLLTGILSGARTWLHVQDFEVDAAFELGQLRSSAGRKAALRLERMIMRQFHQVSTISHKMMERLQTKDIVPERRVFFPNWVDCKNIYPQGRASDLRRQFGIAENKLVALYSGNLGEKQGLDLLADAAGQLQQREELEFVICGNGSFRERLVDMVRDFRNVRLIPLQPLERLNELLNMADIHLLPQRAGAADLVMPSKLNGMLASGRPVIATADPGTQLGEVVRSCGVVTPPGDATSFANAILTLADNPLRREYLGRKAREYAVTNLDRASILAAMEEQLKVLCSGRQLPSASQKVAGSVISSDSVSAGD